MKAVVIVGDESLGGIYVLRLRVSRDTAVQFGRFRGAQAITVPAGDYLYVGSAMRGLAARLLRHASRTDINRPQPIRAALLAALVAAELVQEKRPYSPKRLHWHIDYLLECPDVELTHIFALRSKVRLETAVARWLAQDPATFIVAPGLGARDDPGGTHLLGIRAGEDWWQALPQKLCQLAEAAKSAHNSGD